MRKNDITRLVTIQGFSVRRIEFDGEAIQVETREKEEKFYHKKRHRAKVVRKVPKKVTYLIPKVDITWNAMKRCTAVLGVGGNTAPTTTPRRTPRGTCRTASGDLPGSILTRCV